MPAPVFQDDLNDPRVRDQELACASDREWAMLHGETPGIWRVRRRVGKEGPPAEHQDQHDLLCSWMLVIVVGPKIRMRRLAWSPEEARAMAKAMRLRMEHER